MTMTMTDTIEKTIVLKAPIARVWKALTDYREFGAWFRVEIDTPFVEGARSTGRITVPGFEHVPWNVTVVEMREPDRFAYTWHPYAVDPDIDYAQEEPTRVQFDLETAPEGTRLTVTESGFERIPEGRRPEAIRMNTGGWEAQLQNIRSHVEQNR
jgi:uncharacterized protein YndB with AHSA1/START domain